MTNILYDATLIGHLTNPNQRRGIYFVTVNILKELLERDDVKVILYYDPGLVSSIDYFKSAYKEIFPNSEMPILLNEPSTLYNQCEINAVLNTWLWIPKYLKELPIKKFEMIYDLNPLRTPGLESFLIPNSWFDMLTNDMNTEEFFFTDSEFVRKDILKLFRRIKPENIETILLAANKEVFKPTEKKNREDFFKSHNLDPNSRIIFSLAGIEPRKNFLNMAKSVVKFIEKNNITNMYYIIGGHIWDKRYNEFFDFVKNNETAKKYIKTIGFVPDNELPHWYSFSEWFVFTSTMEGFGLPILEAMQCGTAVVTSNTSSMPEVVQDAGIKVNPFSIEEHVKAFEKFYYDPEFLNKCRKRSLIVASKFSWKSSCNKIIDFINSKINNDEFIQIEEIRNNLLKYYNFNAQSGQFFPRTVLSMENIPNYRGKKKYKSRIYVLLAYKYYSLLSRFDKKFIDQKIKYKQIFNSLPRKF